MMLVVVEVVCWWLVGWWGEALTDEADSLAGVESPLMSR